MVDEFDSKSQFSSYIGKRAECDLEKFRIRVKNYIELDNVSFLLGAGCSYHLGLPLIRQIPDNFDKELKEDPQIKELYVSTIELLDEKNKSYSSISLEDLLNYLQAERFIVKKRNKDTSIHDSLLSKIQQLLFNSCDTQISNFPKEYKLDKSLKRNRYFYHEKFLKKILQRPNNLRRANLFTTNYDLAIDYSLDNLGISYFNGFSGYQKRVFRPETYDYDIYYPGQTTSGKVYRAEKVLRYFKLHGSLSWIYNEPTTNNPYGIEEIKLNESCKNEELIIYPCSTKKSFTLDLPYSELFRLFSNTIKQEQTVLFCLGYSFFDEHINDIITQALSNPSFTLFIVDFKATESSEILNLKEADDPRIIIVDKEYGKFTKFVSDILPDLFEENDNLRLAKTMESLLGKEKDKAPSLVEDSVLSSGLENV